MTPVVFLLLLLLNLQPSNNDVAPKDLAPRIVGGKDCLVKKWPFIVKIVSDFICGGSIITPRHVLTAAHCIVDEVITLRQQRVIAGSSHPGQDESKYNMKKIQVSVVKKGERHKKYDNRDGLDLRYDIGILILEKAMRVTSSVRLAKLPKIGYVDKCKKIKAAGWGLTQVMAIDPSQRPKNMKASRKLQCIELPLYPLDKCMEKWPRHKMDESVICTMYEPGGEDTCKGDSGGPIVCGGFLVGTVSAGAGCATPGMPALYMRVDRHIRFITKHTGINYTVLVQRSHDEAAKRRQTSAASRNTVLTILHVVTSILLTILCQ